jgi:putative oxidoreductase
MNALERAYHTLIFLAGFLQSPLLLICRLYWGGLFVIAGWQKLGDISHFSQLLDNYHIAFPCFTAYLVSLTELIGGLCLFLGLGARLAAIPLIITMTTAYFTVHIASIHVLFQKPSVFVAESPFNFLLTSLLVLAFGPGRFSIDFLLERAFFSKKDVSALSKER